MWIRWLSLIVRPSPSASMLNVFFARKYGGWECKRRSTFVTIFFNFAIFLGKKDVQTRCIPWWLITGCLLAGQGKKKIIIKPSWRISNYFKSHFYSLILNCRRKTLRISTWSIIVSFFTEMLGRDQRENMLEDGMSTYLVIFVE